MEQDSSVGHVLSCVPETHRLTGVGLKCSPAQSLGDEQPPTGFFAVARRIIMESPDKLEDARFERSQLDNIREGGLEP